MGWHGASVASAGVRFVETAFKPLRSTHAGEPCAGVRIVVQERARVTPVRTGIAVALALGKLFRSEWLLYAP